MTPRYRAVKGTRDLFPPETERWAAAEAVCREVFREHGFGEIRTPVLEHTDLFARSVGETTDIVHKEMYTFPDRRGRSLTMRPENTAGVVRAVIEKGISTGPMPLRLYYFGQQFRYERPQAGRYREFRQIGAEPSAAHLADLARRMKADKIMVIVSEPQLNQKVAQALAEETGARVVVLSPPPGAIKGTDTYLAMLEHDVTALVAALRS